MLTTELWLTLQILTSVKIFFVFTNSIVCRDNRNYARVCNIENKAENYEVYQMDR